MQTKPLAITRGRLKQELSTPRRSSVALIIIALIVSAIAAPFGLGQTQSPPAQIDLGPQDISELIHAVAQSEHAMQAHRMEYTWTLKLTEREVNKRGEVTKETVNVFEVYPVKGEFVRKLISENGVPVSPAKADEQLKRAVAKLEKAEQADQKRADTKTPPPTPDPSAIPSFGFTSGFSFRENFSTGKFYFNAARILRAGEFSAPRREQLHGRDVLALDFRPRTDFVPADELQKPYAKLAGRVWLDVADKAVARLEAWAVEPLTVAGIMPALARPAESDIVYEETRLPDGMWLESLVRINTTRHKPVYNGVDVNVTKEMSDFKRFQTTADDAQVEAPRPPQM
ncbi:MAG: hypothetical protein ACJ74W_03150 [Pyrinomonadaceae bacterium]